MVWGGRDGRCVCYHPSHLAMASKRKTRADEEWEKDLAEEDKAPDTSPPRRCAHCGGEERVGAAERKNHECAVCEGWLCSPEWCLGQIRRCAVLGCNEPVACARTLPRTNERGRTCGTCGKMFCARHKRRCAELCGGSRCPVRLCKFCAVLRPFCTNCIPPRLDRDNNNKNEQQS